MSLFSTASASITNAINNAINNGRNGKGCIIIVSSGNYGSSPVEWLASHNNVVAVGATDNNDNRWAGSSYGSELDVMAPTDVYTTDLTGDAGYSSGDYVNDFGGTSASAPHVAGLAGLILSVDNTLSEELVRNIIMHTADDINTPGFDNQTGWGRINAYNAVRSADRQFTLSGTFQKNECWWGNLTLTANITVPSGVTLTISSSATVNLNGYSILSTGGTITIQSGMTMAGTVLKSGGSIAAIYPTIASAISASSSGQTIEVLPASHTIRSNLTVPYGRTLVVDPGVDINVSGDYKLLINGTLEANGTANNDIRFTAFGGDWYGIEFNASYGNEITYCTISNAEYGIHIINSDVDVTWNHINSNVNGIFYNNSYSYFTPVLEYNIIQQNTNGVKCYGYSDPEFNEHNVIRYNYLGVYSPSYYARPVFGNNQYTGFNSFYYNSFYDITSYYQGTIYAENNWWNGSPTVTNNVDYSPQLSSNPNTFLGKNRTPDIVPAALGEIAQRKSTAPDTTGLCALEQAYEFFYAGKFEDALARFKRITQNYPNSMAGEKALMLVSRCLVQLNRKDEIISQTSRLVQRYPATKLYGLAQIIASGEYLRNERYKEAITECEAVLKEFPGTDLAKYALYELGSIYWSRLHDKARGENLYRKLITGWPKDDLTASALSTLGEWHSSSGDGKAGSELTLTAYAVFDNYPNPFNPRTTIRYTLPKQNFVQITVYDLLGREVRSLVNEIKPAGMHQVQFDASDLSSGMYFFTITAGTFHAKKKMLLLK